jgi:hypothetical protein
VATTYQQEYIAFCLFLTSNANPDRNLIRLMTNVVLSLLTLANAASKRGSNAQELINLQQNAQKLVRAVGLTSAHSHMPETMHNLASALSNASLATRIAQEVGPVIRGFPGPPISTI